MSVATAAAPVSTDLLDSLITPETLSAKLGVKITTLAEWRVKGKGPAYIRVGRSPRYRPESIDAWLLAQEHAGTYEELNR
ncbi:helix-turn-helix transcriptional regulator [Demequina iriomotensis]|uniref:helix-turn-helix transcriptional regulator n=1 Tax=Demequina iriomotensis TaxID=1536641 RepID=UPI0007809515|nr:helix-turn-helix domain-containing protein [Demequina iriomotensis]